jgi:hypothetical protein
MSDPKLILRRKTTGVSAVVLLLYTGLGFLAVPPIARKQIVKGAATKLGRDVKVEQVRFNPYALSITVRGVTLQDPDGTAFVGFDELYINFQASSLFRWAYTFREVRLDSLRMHVRLMPDGKPNFADIMERLAAPPPQAKEPAGKPTKDPTVPRIVIQDLQINGARLRATNLQPPEPEVAGFTPVTLHLTDFTTIPNKEGDYTLHATGPFGGTWQWKGRMTFEPMSLEGTFSIDGGSLRQIWEVVRNRVEFEITRGSVGLSLDYAVKVRGDTVTAAIDGGAIRVDDFGLREKGHGPDLFSLDSLRVSGVRLRYPEQDISVDRVLFGGADVTVWLRQSGEINWLSLFPSVPADTARASAGATPTTAPIWAVLIKELMVDELAFAFADSSTAPPFSIGIDPLDLVLRDVTMTPGAEFPLEVEATIEKTGRLTVSGVVGAYPPLVRIDADLRDLPLPIFQPYVDPFAYLEIVSGTASVKGAIEVADIGPERIPDVRFRGGAGSRNLVTKDRKQNEKLVAFRSLDIREMSYTPDRLRISEVVAEGGYAKIVVYPDRTTNLAAVFAPPIPADSTAADSSGVGAPPLPTTINVIKFVDCTADFSDLSLILPFSAGVHGLGGEIRGLSSADTARAEVTMDGSVKPSGSVTVGGEINPLRGDLYTDLSVIFKDFDLPALTPYSGQFAGRKIDKGKLKLDLKYRVAKRELLGENRIVLDQLELGEKVESPDATGLPVGLAVALLKDRNGVIDLDIPVKGNLDDPKFSIKDVIFDVLVNIATKAVTAPFSLLGRLVGFGGGSEEMSHVAFEPGARSLDPAEQEKVAKLGQALTERPQLRLGVRGSFHAEEDGKAIRAKKFAAFVTERMQKEPKKYVPAQGVAHPVRLMRDLHAERFGKDSLEVLVERFQVPEIGKDGKPKKGTVLDEPSFCAEVERILTELQPVADTELHSLAVDRSAGIKNVLVQTAGVDPERIFILDPAGDAELTDGKVRLELELSD